MIEIKEKKLVINNVEYNVISFEAIDDFSFHAVTESNVFCFYYKNTKIDGIICNDFNELISYFNAN